MLQNPAPLPFSQVDPKQLKSIRGVCLDIDDTLSTDGKLTAEAYQALWNLKKAGFVIVPITGRPAGWCDHIVRFWPVDAVVGENGAFVFYMDSSSDSEKNIRIRKRMDTLGESAQIQTVKNRLQDLAKNIQTRFPESEVASDQSYREYDLAIDICEDVKPWSSIRTQELLDYCKSQGAHAKLSSIHVNIWFGDYDKATGFTNWLNKGRPGCSQAPSNLSDRSDLGEWIYIGDSPNDEPMFKLFSKSVGVANLQQYLSKLGHPPTWITQSKSGSGFYEFAEALITSRTAH